MKILKYLLTIISVFMISTILGVVILWYNLDWIVTTQNLKYLQNKFAPQFNVTWDKVNLEVNNDGFLDKEISLLANNETCLTYKNTAMCFEKIDLALSVTPGSSKLWQIEKLIAHTKPSTIALDDFASGKSESQPMNFHQLSQQLQSYLTMLSKIVPEDLSVDLAPLTLQSQASTSKVEGKFNSNAANLKYRQGKLHLTVKMDLLPSLQKFDRLKGYLTLSQPKRLIEARFSTNMQSASLFSTDISLKLVKIKEKTHAKRDS